MKKSISVLVLALLASSLSLTAQNRGNVAPEGAGAKMGKPGMGMMKELNLTDDQKAKLKELHQQFAAQDSVSKVQMVKQREALRADRRQAMAKILTPEQLAQLDKIQVEKGQMRGQMGQMRGQMGQMNGRMGQLNAPMGQGRGQMMNKRAQMLQGRGQMMNKRAQMLQGRGFQNAGRTKFEGRGNSKKYAKAFAKQGNRRGMAPMVNPEVRIKNQVERMTKQLDLSPEQAAKVQAIQEKHFKKDIAKFKKFEKKRDAQFKKRHGNLDEIKAVLTPEQAKKWDALKGQGAFGRPSAAPARLR